MNQSVAVVNFGIPRSGTTLVAKMLERGMGYFHVKLCELHPLHPMNNPNGLITLVNLFVRRRIILVRTVRTLDEVRASLEVGTELGNPHEEILPRIAWHYTQERQGVRRLKDARAEIDERVDLKVIEVPYDALGEPAGREQALRRIARHVPDSETNYLIWQAYLQDVWGTKPVNVGRLMQALEAEAEEPDGEPQPEEVEGDA